MSETAAEQVTDATQVDPAAQIASMEARLLAVEALAGEWLQTYNSQIAADPLTTPVVGLRGAVDRLVAALEVQ